MNSIFISDSEDFKRRVLMSDKPVLVDFFAPWCGPCKMLSHVIEELAKAAEGFYVFKVDTDRLSDVAASFNIRSIPTVIGFINGKENKRHVGITDKDTLISLIR